MSKQESNAAAEAGETALDITHLRRETRTALELAIIALAPTELIDQLATVAGLLEAMVELPPTSAPVLALTPKLAKQGRTALALWQSWQADHLGKVKA